MKGYCHLEAIRLIGLFLSEDLLSSLSNSLRWVFLFVNSVVCLRMPWKQRTRTSIHG